MAKFYGSVGYITQSETAPGVWTPTVTERPHRGDVLKDTMRWNEANKLSDDLTVKNVISVIADPYAYQNLHYIKYVTWQGINWEVSSVEINRPRIKLTLGGVYNG